jgi:hypothetical protein
MNPIRIRILDADTEAERELPAPTALQFAGGPVDISTFSAEPLESAVKNSTLLCEYCMHALSGGDHSEAECDRCGEKSLVCTMRDVRGAGLCRSCAIDAEDANEGGCL